MGQLRKTNRRNKKVAQPQSTGRVCVPINELLTTTEKSQDDEATRPKYTMWITLFRWKKMSVISFSDKTRPEGNIPFDFRNKTASTYQCHKNLSQHENCNGQDHTPIDSVYFALIEREREDNERQAQNLKSTDTIRCDVSCI